MSLSVDHPNRHETFAYRPAGHITDELRVFYDNTRAEAGMYTATKRISRFVADESALVEYGLGINDNGRPIKKVFAISINAPLNEMANTFFNGAVSSKKAIIDTRDCAT